MKEEARPGRNDTNHGQKEIPNQSCRLCLQNRSLQNSHIIPEFIYKPIYDDLHRIHVISTAPDQPEQLIQKGVREGLLCRDCEELLSKFERYASQVLYHQNPVLVRDEEHRFVFGAIDYCCFKLFQLSVLWKASLSQQEFFADVDPGQRHEENVRQMLLSENPGKSHQYGCLIVRFSPWSELPVEELIIQPDCHRWEGHPCYRFLFGGALWMYVVSSHSERFAFNKYFLQNNGELTIVKGPDFMHTALFAGIAERIARKPRL